MIQNQWVSVFLSVCCDLINCILHTLIFLSTSNTFSPTRTPENERWSVCVQEVREELLERLTTTEGTISCGFQLGQDRSNVHITSGCISSAKTSMYNLIQKGFWLHHWHHWHHWHHSARILLRFSWKWFSEASPARQNQSEPFFHVLLKLEAMSDAWLRGKTLTPFNAVKVSKSLRSSIRHESNMSGVPRVFDTLQF